MMKKSWMKPMEEMKEHMKKVYIYVYIYIYLYIYIYIYASFWIKVLFFSLVFKTSTIFVIIFWQFSEFL